MTDPAAMFDQPYVDVDEWRDAPVRHRYVHGGFAGTDTRFSCYFPDGDRYQGRFFQHITPVPDSEHLAQLAKGAEDKIGFAIASGAYFLETNGGGRAATGRPGSGVDPTIAAYRANAACAQYSRVVAAKIYGDHRPYGYAYGGSGGGFRTIGGIENTTGVWDGAVPYVIGSPMSIPNVFTVRMHALRVLQHAFPRIVDAVDAGGSGDPYAGLDEEQREALQEATRMGFPPRSWFAYRTMGPHAFALLFQGMLAADPGYFEDFWNVPGYLGSRPTPSLLAARIQHDTAVAEPVTPSAAAALGVSPARIPGQPRGAVDTAWQSAGADVGGEVPIGFRLADVPRGADLTLADLIVRSGAAAGKRVSLRGVSGDVAVVGPADPEVLAAIAAGDEVRIDNSHFLASQTYHRHQVPTPDFPVFDQFRGPDGTPRYPQRPMLLGPLFAQAASGTVQSGRFEGKMIVVESLLDREAYPWQADWYRSRVREHLGPRLDDRFRLWFTDNAVHGDSESQEDPTRTVSYLGSLHQALRDLSAWVERGVAPPASTSYAVVDGQVVVPPGAAERRGIQPVVRVQANGAARAEVGVGEPVRLTAEIEVPPGTGVVVAAEWDFDGRGAYPVAAELPSPPRERVAIETSFRFLRPGTWFPVLRAASQRSGDADTPYARIQNLGRVRVVVREPS